MGSNLKDRHIVSPESRLSILLIGVLGIPENRLPADRDGWSVYFPRNLDGLWSMYTDNARNSRLKHCAFWNIIEPFQLISIEKDHSCFVKGRSKDRNGVTGLPKFAEPAHQCIILAGNPYEVNLATKMGHILRFDISRERHVPTAVRRWKYIYNVIFC
jgi:hypothetical protein